MHHIIRKNILCYIVFYILLWVNTPCYAQRYGNSKSLYNYNDYIHKREMIFALTWNTDYEHLFFRTSMIPHSEYEVNLCHKYTYKRGPVIFDLTELLVRNNYDSIKNIWFPASHFKYNVIDYDPCSVNNFLDFLVSHVVKDSLDYNQINVLSDADNKLILSASKVARRVHLKEMRYNELYLFKCTVSYFSAPSKFISIPNLGIKYKQIKRDFGFERNFNDLKYKGLLYNKFDHVMRGLIFTPMSYLLFKAVKVNFNYIYDISEIEVFPVSKIKAYKKQMKSGLK